MTIPSDPLLWAVGSFRDGRNEKYSTYAAYLDGRQPLSFASVKFRSAFGQLFEAFAYNRCASVVDAHTDRLRVTGFGADDDAIAQAAQDLWDANRMDVREGQVEADQLALGDSYVIAEMHPSRGDVQLWAQDPRLVRVHYGDDAPGELDLGTKVWYDDQRYCHLNLYFRDRIEKYISVNRAPAGVPTSTSAFQLIEIAGEQNPVPLAVTDTVPIFHFANNGRTNAYGTSELRPIIPLQDAINKTLMDMLVAMEFAAFPQRVLIGVEADDPESEAKLARFQAGIDRILTLFAPDAKIGEFSAVNIAQYLSVAEFWDTAISRVSKVPVHYLGMNGTFASGRALRIAETPFTAKIEDRQRSAGQTWGDAQTYGLRLQGKNVAPGAIRVNWASAAPMSEEDRLGVANEQKLLGIPLEQILKEAGYEPTQIADIMTMKQQAVADAQAAFAGSVLGPNHQAAFASNMATANVP